MAADVPNCGSVQDSRNSSLSTQLIGGLAALLYLTGAGVQAWRIAHRNQSSRSVLLTFGLPAFAGHALVTWAHLAVAATPAGAEHGGVALGILAVASTMTLIAAALVLIASVRIPLAPLSILLFPGCAIVLLALLLRPLPTVSDVAFRESLLTHILASIAAYSVLMIGVLQSLLLAAQENLLRHRERLFLLRFLPPLESMEQLLFELLWLGLLLLSLAIASGFFFLDDIFAQRVVHHTVFACLAWLTYATLLACHHFFGWRGTRAIRWTLIGFGFLVLGYFGSKVVIEVIIGNAA